jgi:hypothetical protein
MKARSARTAAPPSRDDLARLAALASAEADFNVARAAECDRWGLLLEAAELRRSARERRVASLLFMGRAAAAPTS